MAQPHHHISCTWVNPGHHPTTRRCHGKMWQPYNAMSAQQASHVPVGVNHGCTSASLAGQACGRSLHPLPCPTPSLSGIKSLCGCLCWAAHRTGHCCVQCDGFFWCCKFTRSTITRYWNSQRVWVEYVISFSWKRRENIQREAARLHFDILIMKYFLLFFQMMFSVWDWPSLHFLFFFFFLFLRYEKHWIILTRTSYAMKGIKKCKRRKETFSFRGWPKTKSIFYFSVQQLKWKTYYLHRSTTERHLVNAYCWQFILSTCQGTGLLASSVKVWERKN